MALTISLALLALATSAAQGPDDITLEFPGYPETRAIRSLKARADKHYEEGRYERAFHLYRRRLAFLGDKYAQYMAGYQYLHGQGVDRDLPWAFAWYRLAAERGHADLVRVRDELTGQLNPDQHEVAAAHFNEIVRVYGDERILERLVFRDKRELGRMTGSRLGATIGALTVFGRDGTGVDATSYYGPIEARMLARLAALELLRGRVEYGELQVEEPEQPTEASPARAAGSDDAP